MHKLLEKIYRFLFSKSINAEVDKFFKNNAELGSESESSLTEKNIHQMTEDEFYNYLTKTSGTGRKDNAFYSFMFDYILTAYLDGELDSQALTDLLGIDNPYEMNRYAEKMMRGFKLQGNLYEDLAHYEQKGAGAEELYSLVLPNYIYDKEKKELKIKSFKDMKDAIKASQVEMEKQRRLIEYAKMQAAERTRIKKNNINVLANSPEVAEMILDNNNFSSEAQEIEKKAHILYDQAEKDKKKVVIRRAKQEVSSSVSNKRESEMSPAELIAYRRQVLQKLRRDVDSSAKGGSLNIRR